MWTDAFTIFISVYISAHPEDISGLLKYMHTVKLGARRTGGLTWKSYDEQFRLKKVRHNSLRWYQVYQELWLLYMYGNSGVVGNKSGQKQTDVCNSC